MLESREHRISELNELKSRNQKLVFEVLRLQEQNRMLRKKINTLMLRQLNIIGTKFDQETQTEIMVCDTPRSSFGTANNRSSTGTTLSFDFLDRKDAEPPDIVLNDKTIEIELKSGCKLSPCLERVSSKLTFAVSSPSAIDSDRQRISTLSPCLLVENQHTPQGVTTPRSEDSIESTPNASRTPRSTRKPISYQEPSLRVKVRKGFKFFQF